MKKSYTQGLRIYLTELNASTKGSVPPPKRHYEQAEYGGNGREELVNKEASD